MSKTPTAYEASELIFVLREHKGIVMPMRLLCRELDIDRRYFPKLLKIARNLADVEGLLIMNDGNDCYYLMERKKVNGRKG